MRAGGPTPGDWSRIEEVFDEALLLPAAERPAFLEASGLEPALRAEVEALLEQHERDPDFLETPAPWLTPAAGKRTGAEWKLPERVGPYKVVRALGRGGMGSVLLAEREASGFRREVALKVMRRGLDTDDLIRRFRAERQILATLDHPNIAKLLDVGATDDGLPYFVMERVEGTDILEHCRARAMPLEGRLALFRAVCSAVHHAHQRLVVHRDLKPANILVTDAGVPKLLDFGIAKILGPEGTGHTTRFGERLLTPRYSAPEQLRGERVTTACDVWALGILLYELLADRHPFESEPSAPAEEVARGILEREPAPPSAVAPLPRRRALTGDLDTIVLKALRKDPGERYESVSAFSEDVRRHLEGLPVEARPATIGYRVRTFVRRNRLATATAAGVFVLLTGFSSVTAWQANRIRLESERVADERDKALEVRAFLLETFGITGPQSPRADTVAVRDLLDRRAATLDDAFSADPDLRAEMRGVLAEAYDQLGLHQEALPLAQRALEEKRALYGASHPDVAVALNNLGWIMRQNGQLEEAEATLVEALAVGRAAFPEKEGDARLARILNDLGVVREAQGEYDEAAELYRESLAMRRGVLGDAHVGVAVTTNNLAVVLYRNGDVDGAAAMAAEAVEAFRRALGEDHQRTLVALGNLASLNGLRDDHEGAAAAWRRILARHRRVLGQRHPQTAYAMMMLANHLSNLHRDTEAEPLIRDALALQRETLGPRHERVAQALRVLGDIEHGLGRSEDALDRYAEATAIVRALVGDTHRELAVLRLREARALDALGSVTEAGAAFREAEDLFARTVGPDHYLRADARLSLFEFVAIHGSMEEAESLGLDLVPLIDSLATEFPKLAARMATARERLATRASRSP